MKPIAVQRVVRWLRIVAVAGAVLSFFGCSGGDGAAGGGGDGEAVVVTTIWPLADLTRQVVGKRARVVSLVPAGTTPHGFEPTTRDVEALRGARLLVTVGLGFDDWATEAMRRHGRADAATLVFAEAVGAGAEGGGGHGEADGGGAGGDRAGGCTAGGGESGHGHETGGVHDHGAGSADEHDHDHGHDHGAVNPHVWLDPVLTARFVEALGERLAAELPGAAEAIRANAVALHERIEALEAEYRRELAPHRGRKIVTFHNAFDRLAERYGLVVAATLTPIESPGSLTPGRVERALSVIEAHGLEAVFAEPQFPPDAGRVLRAEKPGLRILVLDPLGDPYTKGRDSYEALMRYNLATLLEGLGPASPKVRSP